jgi:hypothetical protein
MSDLLVNISKYSLFAENPSMLKDKIDNGAFLLLQCSLVESSELNCEFVVVVVRSLAEYSGLDKSHAVSLDDSERTFVDILLED